MLNNLLRTSIVILAEAEQTGPFTAEDFVDKLFPSGFFWGAVTQILAFLVLILIVWKLLYNPVKKILVKRQNTVEENINSAEIMREEMEKQLAESEELIKAERQKAQALVAEALKQSEKAKEELIEQAKAEIEIEKAKAREEIAQARKDAEEEIRSEIINVALLASKEIIGREINEQDSERLVNDFIKDMTN